ncbi:MAG: GAF domain-containing sensor histidine kinase [Acidimicrobiia bacterium]|nr:GAF domain-containing sensor histidine kinase [Acidimicrobiia bacterium]
MATTLNPDRLGELFVAAADVGGQTDLRQVLLSVVQTAMQATGAKYGALGVLDTDGSLDEFLHVGLDDETVALIGPPPTGNSLLGTVSRGSTIRVSRISDHPDSVGFPDHHPPMDAFLGVPLRTGDQLFGNLYLTEKEGGFTEEDQVAAETLALIGGTAVVSNLLHARLNQTALFDDRERIARDVHDAVIQDLFAVGLSLEGASQRIDDDAARETVSNAIQRLDECITSLRHVIFDLTRQSSGERSVVTEVSELVQELAESYGRQVDLTVSGVFGDIADSVADAMMHVIKEATSNALRHSGASTVSVAVAGGAVDFRVAVHDEGSGFDQTQLTPGLGLKNIKRRVSDLGGTVEIASHSGVGTLVTISLPRRV